MATGSSCDRRVRTSSPRPTTPLGPASRGDVGLEPCAVCGTRTQRFGFNQAPAVRVDACEAHGQWVDAWDARHLIAWRRKEAGLTAEITKGTHPRQRDRILAWTWDVYGDFYAVRAAVAAVFWLAGSPVSPVHAFVGLVFLIIWFSEVPVRILGWLGFD